MITNTSKTKELETKLFSGLYFVQGCGGDEYKVFKVMIELPVNEAKHHCRPPRALGLAVLEGRLWALVLLQAGVPCLSLSPELDCSK